MLISNKKIREINFKNKVYKNLFRKLQDKIFILLFKK